MIVIGDCHGCYKTFKALLKKLPKKEKIYLVGDLVDRGPRSKEIIEYLIKHPEIESVLGNHESMMLESLGTDYQAFNLWQYNGGGITLQSYASLKTPKEMEIPEEHEKYLKSLPLYIETKELIISHSGDIMDNWSRGIIYPDSKKFHIHGHTLTGKPIITDHYANIDTGCAYEIQGYGVLTAIQYASMKIFQQENID